MDALTLAFVFAVVFALDWIGFKYHSIFPFLLAGLLAMFALANVAADNSITVDFASTPYSFVPPSGNFLTWLAMLSLTAIMQFVAIIERQTAKDPEF